MCQVMGKSVNSKLEFHLCHLNIGPAKGHIHGPVMKGFVDKLNEINQLAYQSPGFVWHLIVDIYNPDDLAMCGEPGLLFNMSVWESLESLKEFTYKSNHKSVLQRRTEWFGEMDGPSYVLWWMPVGELPTLEEAKLRIAYLKEHGPSLYAFDFKHPFPPPGDSSGYLIIPGLNPLTAK